MTDQRIPPDEWRRMQRENGQTLERAIIDLENDYNLGFMVELARSIRMDTDINFSDLWTDVKSVQEQFITLRPTDRSQRDELWGRFNRFRDAAREAQKACNDRHNRDCTDNYNQVNGELNNIANKYDLDMIGNFTKGNYGPTKGFREDADEVRHLLTTLKFRRDDREELWNRLNKMWASIKERNETKRHEWQKSQQEYIWKLEERLEKSCAFLNSQNDQLYELREKRDSARTDDFRQTVEGWISSREDKISDAERQIDELKDKIYEAKARLNE